MISSIILVALYSSIGILTWTELIPPYIIEYAAMALYCVATGLFVGGGAGLIKLRMTAGYPEYARPDFFTDGLPNVLAIAIVAYGIYRTSIMNLPELTLLSLTSGLSLVGFGFYGWCIEVVPEFRNRGIILLDQFIPWELVVAYRWDDEDILTIEYHSDKKLDQICEFHTSIPPEDRRVMELLLTRKLDEFETPDPDEDQDSISPQPIGMN
ncbi:MAG: hypothetical protein ACQETE_13700 [Bacteroidota bacterium]